MTAGKLNRFWTMITLLLVAITAIGGLIAWSRYSPSQPMEISIAPHQELEGNIIPEVAEEPEPQKININRAEAWLLEALPGIGEIKAQAILDYRQQNGPFLNINQLTKVEGIGITIYERIKHLITVAD